MKQPIAGLVPADVGEATVIVRFPCIGSTPLGRLVGKMCGFYPPWDRFRLLSKLLALAAIPLGLVAYFARIMPGTARRYRLTNRRVMVQKGLRPREERSIGLDQFDVVDIVVQPGHEFHHAGDLVFRRGGQEVFRLPAVSRPEPFRAACLKVRAAMLAVREVTSTAAAGNLPLPQPAAAAQGA